MIEKEHELKMLISLDDFRRLKSFFGFLPNKTISQTNYYYDTRNGVMRRENTTVRVRKKDNRFKGTIKRHLANGYSTEENFNVDTLPLVIVVDNIPVWIKGSLDTERTVFTLCDGLKIMFDLNQYLDVVDCEIEIEFREDLQKQAEWLMNGINALLKNNANNDAGCKSERLLRVFENKGGGSYA